jgi:hypothetical protein
VTRVAVPGVRRPGSAASGAAIRLAICAGRAALRARLRAKP